MNSSNNVNWNKLFEFENEEEKLEHEADMLSLKTAIAIKELIDERGITKKELANLMGTSPAYVTQVLRGDKRINLLFLVKVNKALNTNIEVCFDRGIESDKEQFDSALNIAKPQKAIHFHQIKQGYEKCIAGARN